MKQKLNPNIYIKTVKKILLSAEESRTLLNVLAGKKAVINVRKSGEYQAEKIILSSCGGESFRFEVEDFPALKDLDKLL